MSSLYRIQNSLQDVDILARDRFVNTIYVTRVNETIAPTWTAVGTAIKAFFTALAAYLPYHAQSSANTIKIYDMAQAKIRTPIYSEAYGPAGSPDSTNLALPNEVACCLSFHATNQALPIRRQSTRGRVYLGPLSVHAIGSSAGAVSQISGTFAALILAKALVLNQDLVNAGAEQVVASTTHHTWYNLISYSVDSAFDTQRRRGERPTWQNNATIPSVAPRVGTW
jgi:hypothetical protein